MGWDSHPPGTAGLHDLCSCQRLPTAGGFLPSWYVLIALYWISCLKELKYGISMPVWTGDGREWLGGGTRAVPPSRASLFWLLALPMGPGAGHRAA